MIVVADNKPYLIVYEFVFENNRIKKFTISLNPKTIEIIPHEKQKKASWAKLKNNQCVCCPLNPRIHKYCPISLNIAELVEEFKEMISSDSCLVRCIIPERIYIKQTSIMEGLSSIFGIIMATSSCPIMAFLKPMARFHLPFSTVEETVVRSTSMYLLRQYFAYRKNKIPDLALKKLDNLYANVKLLNKGILARIKSVVAQDADMNAIFILHSLSENLTMEIDFSLESLEYLFMTEI
ncbi:MAG: hypothetical protein HQK76_08880 [Desulfobacterales bacterium]|nr:hypothetical protein [Desulfobacterales bacterium]